MSLKQEIETWVTALAAYDHNEFDTALKCFEQIADTSKILFNVGVINATLGEHVRAVEFYQRAVALDQYLAVAYFQQGVSNFLLGDFEEALANFNDTLLYLRGNNNIDYEQLGLKFKLYSCEVLFNRGLCYIYLQQKDAGMQDLIYAAREKIVVDHDVIDEAIKEHAEGYTVFSIPVGIVYRPNEAKVKNLQSKDYLGKARLVAAQDRANDEARRVDPRRQAAMAAMGIDDRHKGDLSWGALNLVKPDLKSRSRQQSEPPLHRNVFPPTPPPEPDRPESSHGHAQRRPSDTSSTAPAGQQLRSGQKPLPLRLELGAAAFDYKPQSEKPRLGTKRSESERPSLRREFSNSSHASRDEQRRERKAASHKDLPQIQVASDPVEPRALSGVSPSTQQQYQQQQHQHRRSRSSAHAARPQQPGTISEEADEHTQGEEVDIVSPMSTTSTTTLSPLAFEIVPPHHHHHHHSGPRHRSRSRKPASISPPEMRKLRLKLHAADDMRYLMTTPGVTFDELGEQIRLKCSLTPGGFKLKIKDEEGDMVTMGDQDDWDMALGICRAAAEKEAVDMGKMEIWIMEVTVPNPTATAADTDTAPA